MARRMAYNDFLEVVRVFFSQECSLILMTYRHPNHKSANRYRAMNATELMQEAGRTTPQRSSLGAGYEALSTYVVVWETMVMKSAATNCGRGTQ